MEKLGKLERIRKKFNKSMNDQRKKQLKHDKKLRKKVGEVGEKQEK